MKQFLIISFLLVFQFTNAQQSILPVEINNKWGFINLEGKVVIPAKYEMPIDFNESGLAIAVRGNKYGIINQNGEEVMTPKFNELMWLNSSLLSFRKDSLWGVINLKETVLIEPKFLEISYFDNFIHTYSSHHHSIYNLKGKNIISPTNFTVKMVGNFWLVENEEMKYGLFDINGNEVLSNICDSIKPINDSLILFKTQAGWNTKYLAMLKNDLNWRSVKVLYQYILAVELTLNKFALYNVQTNEYLSEKEFADFKLVNSAIILGYKHHVVTAFSLKGKMYPILDFEDIKPIGFGLFEVKKSHKLGVVNEKGVELITPELDKVLLFVYSVTSYKKDSLWGIINKKGGVLEKPIFSKIEITDGHARLFKNGVETAIRFNSEGEIDANFNNMNTIHIGSKKKKDFSTHLRKVDPVFSTNCFALYHEGEAAGSLIHRDMIKQAFTLYNSCTNEYVKSNVKLLDANLEDFTNQEVTACIIEGGNFGVLHKNGHVLTTAEILENGKPVQKHITYVSPFSEGLSCVCIGGELNFNVKTDVLSGLTYYFDVSNIKGGYWGVIDSKGVFVIPPIYQNVSSFVHNTAIVKQNNLWGVINKMNQNIVPIQYNGIERMPNSNDSLFLISEDLNEKGYTDRKGNIVLNIDYDLIQNESEGIVPVKKNGKWGFVSIHDQRVSELIYDDVHEFSDSICAVKLNKKWGFIDYNFKLVIPNKFESISNFSHQLAFVKEQNHFEIINKKGEVSSNLKLKEVFDYEHGVAIAKKDDGYGLINTKGEWIVNPKFHKIMPFNKHKSAVAHASPGKHVLINTKGEHISFHQFDSIDEFHEGYAVVKLNGQYGYIDTVGNLIIEAKFEEAHPFSNGLAKVRLSKEEKIKVELEGHSKKHHKFSFINYKGEIVISDLLYDHIHAFSNDMALVYLKNEKFFINKSGLPELDLKDKDIEIIHGFEEEKAIVHHKWNNREYYIDKDGDKLFGKTFQKCGPFVSGVAIVKDDEKYGLLSENGTFLIDYKYDLIKDFKGNLAEVELVHKYGIIDLKGNVILEPNAEMIIPITKNVIKVETSNSLKYIFKNGKWLWR